MNAPKLRFKRYTNNWKHKLMSEVVAINPKVGSLPERFIYIDLDSVNSGVLVTKKIIEKKNAPSRAQRLLSDQDILIQTVRPYQKNHLLFKTLEMESVASTGYAQLKTKVEIDPEFIYQLFYTGRINEEINKRCTGTSYPAISAKDLETLYISIPSYDEQVRISVFLKTIDKKIQLQQEKIDLLKEQKKGFLQKMFSKSNEKNPETRFNGFIKDWKECKLGDIVDFYSGLTYSPDDVLEKDGTFVLRSSNIKSGNIVNADNVYVDSHKVNSEKVIMNDIIVVVRNGSRSLIGKHAIVKKEMPNTVIGAFMTGIRAQSPNFINALLDTEKFDIEISKNLGATINQITTGSFKKMVFRVPQKEEQDKIGLFFRKMDDSIEIQQQKLGLLQQQKQAFMQQMFI